MFDVLVSLGRPRPWRWWPGRTAVRRAADGPGSALVPPLGTFVTAATMLCLSLGAVAGRWLGWQAALGTAAVIYLVAGIGVPLTRHRQPGPPPYTRPGASYLAGAPLVLPFVLPDGAPGIRTTAGTHRAGEERRRIARELHDSLTHNITLITVQAGIAVHLARQRGEPVPDTLLAIQDAAGEAMRELRATLAVLRDPDGAPAVASLDRLPGLVARARSAGLSTSVTITGEPRALPPDVDHAAYRIVQEALTNITRHAGGASASVRIAYRPGTLSVRIDDDGRATPGAHATPGVGLIGMRERVAALGGRLRAGARDEGGFTVRAELPLRTDRPGPALYTVDNCRKPLVVSHAAGPNPTRAAGDDRDPAGGVT